MTTRTYRGKPIEEMSRDELIAAVIFLLELTESLNRALRKE